MSSRAKQLKAKRRKMRARQSRASRRGVLLLVVLSMLVLFMLIGTAFLMSGNQSRKSMKEASKQDRLGNAATRLLDRAAFQLVRDTENPASVIRYHSLLRDVYGTDGLQGVVYIADIQNEPGFITRFAGATASPLNPLGPTNGQFIDIYVGEKEYTIANGGNPIDYSSKYDAFTYPLDLKNVLKLDRNPYGLPQPYPMPLTKGYFNGCLLTLMSGPAAGQSARILDYECVAPALQNATLTTTARRMFRFRVMAFQRADGQPLTVNTDTSTKGRPPELSDLAGQSIMVNGRAFGGTGVGYNPLATTGQPRLSALQMFPTGGSDFIGAELALLPNAAYFNPLDPTFAIAAAPQGVVDPFLAPLPIPASNFGKYAAGTYWPLNNLPGAPGYDSALATSFAYSSYASSGGTNEGYDAPDFQNMALALQTVTPRSQGRVVHTNTADPLNPLILDLSDPTVLSNSKSFLRLDLEDVPVPSFHRPDLVNFWYHRLLKYLTSTGGMQPDDAVRAIIQPYSDDRWTVNTNASGLTAPNAALISAIKRQIMFRPTLEDHPHFDGSNQSSIPTNLTGRADLTVNGNIAIAPWEVVGPYDVDNDNDGVRDSIWVDLGDPIQQTEDGRRYKPLYAFLCVDLDSRLNVNAHGLADDLLPPLDGNGNSLDITRTSFFDPTFTTNLANTPGNMARPATNPLIRSTLQLARGIGYGPPEISLRPLFPTPLDDNFKPTYGNQTESNSTNNPIDSYATVLAGRKDLDGQAISGRYGFNVNANILVKSQEAEGGTNYKYGTIVTSGPGAEPPLSPRWFTGEQAIPDLAAQLKFFDYPWSVTQQTAYGIAPDLKSRYALGVDFAGQPNYEVRRDVNPNTATLPVTQQLPFNLLANTPYELDLSGTQRRDLWASRTNAFGPMADPVTAFQTSLNQNDDSPYSPTDLEKVLRAHDADAGTLPSRLWNTVDAFDPYKLAWFDSNRVASLANDIFDPTGRSIAAVPPYQSLTSQVLITAQEMASINRRLVTTDSSDLPVANQTMPAYVSEFGADGAPGRRGQANQILNAPGTDDFQTIVGVSRAQAKLTDLLRYRVWLEARRYEVNRQKLTERAIDALSAANYSTFMSQVNMRADAVISSLPQLTSDLLAPEVIAGKRMDLNRPFGDGKDNAGDGIDNDNNGIIDEPSELGDPLVDGVVDDPLESGEPFLDVNGNGRMDVNSSGAPLEPYIDLNGNKRYEGPRDNLWPELGPTAVGGNGTLAEPITFDYTNGHWEPLHGRVRTAVAASLGKTLAQVPGGVRNLDSQGRQLFARQLYCLALLLMDENYIAPWDEKDPQINKLLDTSIVGSLANRLMARVGPAPAAPATDPNLYEARVRAMLLRKLTCRTIAQWAVNCVDMRDPDVIMTPFEYDENPWDGWGEWDDNWNKDPVNETAAFKTATFLPLDGDPATNENDAWVIDWSTHTTANLGHAKVFSQLLVNQSQPLSSSNPPIITIPFNQTRGVVWGAERPELLITETLAWHDRRTDDRKSQQQGKHDELHGTDAQNYPDIDMDQHLRPKGSLFVELYNPWSPDGQLPAELYTRLDETDWNNANKKYNLTAAQGVDLSRLSNFGVSELYNAADLTNPNDARLTTGVSGFDTNTNRMTKRSPVWRLIVVDDWPRARNRERARIGNDQSQTSSTTTSNSSPQFAGYDQHLGNTPPDAKLNLPIGVPPITGNKLPAYLQPMVGGPTIRDTVEGWDASQAPPYRAPDPDLEEVFSAGFFDSTGAFTKLDGGFNAAFTPTQVASLPPRDPSNVNLFNVEYPYIEREFYFTTDNSPTATSAPGDVPWGQFIDATTKPVDWDYSPNKFKIRIPDRFVLLSGFPGTGPTVPNGPPVPTNVLSNMARPPLPPHTWARTQKFIPIALEQQKAANTPVLAPIKPGRYGVIGTAGARFFKDPANPNVFTIPVGRPDKGNTKYADDQDLQIYFAQARRIEMRPSRNPDLQQLVVSANGGDPKDQIQLGGTMDPFATEIGRDNELIRNDTNNPPTIENITEPDTRPGNVGGAKFYKPCVAVPVEGMSASDPPWGWIPREYQAAGQELDVAIQQKREHDAKPGATPWNDPTLDVYTFDPRSANGEGGYTNTSGTTPFDVAYDKPFDIASELIRTGTTPNYRTTHLQRLANPELPWNPPPGQYKDAYGTDLYRPNLPVNPYRTIDSSTVNLTTFNGTSSEEHAIGATADQAKEEGKLRPWERGGGGAGGAPSELGAYLSGLTEDDHDPQNTTHSPKQAISFKSAERGFWSRLSEAGRVGTTATNAGVWTPQRMLWSQEPALVDIRRPGVVGVTGQLIDLLDGRQMTMRVFDEIPKGEATPPKNPGFGPMDNLMENTTPGSNTQHIMSNHCDLVLKHTLGFGNESFGLLYDKIGARRVDFPNLGPKGSTAPIASAIGSPAPSRFIFPYDVDPIAPGNVLANPGPPVVDSTYPWLAWDNRPYVSGDELLKVPAVAQSQVLRQSSAIDPNVAGINQANPYGLAALGVKPTGPSPAGNPAIPNRVRRKLLQAPFGDLVNVLGASSQPADVVRDTDWLQQSDASSTQFVVANPLGVPVRFTESGVPLIPDDPSQEGNIRPYGAPNFSRILDYVQTPSRFVGTDTMLNAETFNDAARSSIITNEPVGTDMADAQISASGSIDTDARYFFQPPFNKVARERDPGRVNLNTVTGRRNPPPDNSAPAQIWSEVFDGIMHRFHDGNLVSQNQLGHFGPAWRDVVLSRRGYAQFNADSAAVPVERLTGKPDVFAAGLNPLFPSMFANPFRSADSGDLVPVLQMMQFGADATLFRKHPYDRALDPNEPNLTKKRRLPWGQSTPVYDDARDAGFGANESVSVRAANGAIPNDNVFTNIPGLQYRDTLPLFSEARDQPFADTNRNPYMMYEPMSRLGNLVTNRSGVYAVWITVGYFEVEKAPDWFDPDDAAGGAREKIRNHFGNDINLYNRAYPDGYMLGKELNSETGDVRRPRGFYIIDRTEEVGFKPGEDLNVEKTIRLRRRIE